MSVTVSRERLDQAVQKAIDERKSGWERKRLRNGRKLSWRIPHASKKNVEVCVWPSAFQYVITDTDPDNQTYFYERDADTAVRLAEEYAGLPVSGQPV